MRYISIWSLPLPVMVSTILWPYTSCTHDARVSTNTNSGVPDPCFPLVSVFHEGVNVVGAAEPCISFEGVHKDCCWPPSAASTMFWFPNYETACYKFRVSNTVCPSRRMPLAVIFWPRGVCRKDRRSLSYVRHWVLFAASWCRHRRAVLLLCCESPDFGPIPGVIAIEESVFRFGLHFITPSTK